ncbi:hypothetical protein ACQUZK_09025, partial [Streptococcus pyogenes]|uniref:hypothetical protein n=1 Tax=Streptococcus pyogenes TaxID=1314 RepID=UPI003DA19A0F
WREYLAGIRQPEQLLSWTFRYWNDVGGHSAGPVLHEQRGCFGFTRESAELVRIHFVPSPDIAGSPLAPEALAERMTELRLLFSALPESTVVQGRSWLYNLPRYRSLFPKAYLETAAPVQAAWTRLPLWGQLLHADGNVREPEAAHFLQQLGRARAIEDLTSCFRHPVLALEGRAHCFQQTRIE